MSPPFYAFYLCLQPFIVLNSPGTALFLEETNISVPVNASMCGVLPETEPDSTLSRVDGTSPVALRLQDQTQALVAKTHLMNCVVEKHGTTYLVHSASSFRPELPKATAAARLAWSLDEVYALACKDYSSFIRVCGG